VRQDSAPSWAAEAPEALRGAQNQRKIKREKKKEKGKLEGGKRNEKK